MATAIRTPEELKDIERTFIDEVWNGKELTKFDEYVSEDYVGHWYDVGKWDLTADGFREFLGDLFEAFPDFELTPAYFVAEDDMVTVGFTTWGTHTGEFLGIPATEIEGEIAGIMTHRVDETGKFIEGWAVWDTLSLLQQLGVAPEEFTLASFLETGARLAKKDVLKLAKGR